MNDCKIYPGTYPHNWQPVLLHQYLLQYAQNSPNAIAIISANCQWSYQDLFNYSHTYADILDDRGLAAGDRIILELESCPQAIALIIACSLLGLVFVPVSPETPPGRLAEIVVTTEAKLHIQESSNEQNISNSDQILLGFLDGNSLHIPDTLPTEFRSRRRPVLESDLAYIIFTSGTTGNPKGIMMTHRAVIAFFRALVNYCQLSSPARIGTIAPLQFDFSLLDMGLALGSGATLVQIPRKLTLIPPKLLRYINRHQITQLNCVPSIWKLLLHYAAQDIAKLQHLKTTLFAGESFAIADIIQLRSLLPQVRIINCFGQSESIACSFTEVPNPLFPDTKNLSIGFAHPGAEMLLLDEEQNEINQPDQIGEIYLRGANLFSGYWRNPEITNKALIPNPLNPLSEEKVFRTGDLAYKGSKGELYLAGRRDLQVKIMGNRVELEEIERRLREHPRIAQVAAIAQNNQENTTLAAFLVVEENKSVPTAQEIRLFCGETMPNYMIPPEIHFLDNLPLTINSKIDRKALKAIPISRSKR
ncbi:AMP-binding protein [Pleurocapsa sp. PCC 7319]|uniref:AMP-binding protein n=1 Tax=Pleurocapsa sp. PCC 7319 TaxID=118161 RepID=UPI000348BA07|nr:AMP-binding protein [Pleurocapsa sp. PCC 7319]